MAAASATQRAVDHAPTQVGARLLHPLPLHQQVRERVLHDVVCLRRRTAQQRGQPQHRRLLGQVHRLERRSAADPMVPSEPCRSAACRHRAGRLGAATGSVRAVRAPSGPTTRRHARTLHRGAKFVAPAPKRRSWCADAPLRSAFSGGSVSISAHGSERGAAPRRRRGRAARRRRSARRGPAQPKYRRSA